VQFNNRFFEELGRSPGVRRVVDEAADRVQDIAQSTAPEDSGEYRDGIVRTSKYQRRYVAEVIATDPKSMLIESKTGNLARAVQRAKRRSRG